MGNLWRLLEWIGLVLGVVIAGMAMAFLLTRRRILRHVEGELGREVLLLATGARVGAYDHLSDGKTVSMAGGVLMLLSTGLYFHSWVGSREVFVPGPSISWIGVSETRGHLSERHRIVVRFLNAAGKEDGIIIQLLYPAQWVAAIKTHLITRAG
jgi:hypothetical protein